MALRDARHGLKPLFLSMACVILGVASVVIAFSFRANLQSSVESQAKTLLGADLSIDSREPFSPEAESLIRSVGGDQSRQISFSSMAYFPGGGGSRLVQVRALQGNFPYYGLLETEPAAAAQEFQRGAGALVDENVMLQFNAKLGDRVRIGEQEFRIVGKLKKIPGETLVFSLINPRVYIPLGHFNAAQLIKKGSIVRYRVYFKLDPKNDPERVLQNITPELSRLQLQADTVQRRTAAISAPLDNLARYLRLAIFIAVLLAGVGVASGIHVYAKQKTSSVAILRCVGAGPRETVLIYLVQAFLITLAGSVIGAVLGAALQSLLPRALQEFLPIAVEASVSYRGIAVGMGIGVGLAVLFSLLPLVPLRKISPLLALRSSYEFRRAGKDWLLWSIVLIIAAAVAAFAVVTTGSRFYGLCFAAGVALTFGFLGAISRGLIIVLRKLAPNFLPFSWRQGIANLHRPNNQTAAVMVSVGLGTFLLVTLYSVQTMLLNEVAERSGKGEPNLVLFDVQKEQKTGVEEMMKSFAVRFSDAVPLVTMRLASVKGRSVDEIRADPSSRIPRWVLRREYRSTYRSQLRPTEKVIKGVWQGKVNSSAEPVPISLEKGIAESLHVTVGDALEFDIQGVSVPTRVASLREVDWQRVQPNFFVVFPEGVLDDAPQFYAVAVRSESQQVSVDLQRAIAERFPNVSVIDLSVVFDTLDAILAKISSAIRAIALFTILTGLAVLASAVLSSRSQRLRESILLRTLGAPRGQIIRTVVAEYIFLGMIASVSGALLGILSSWGLSLYFFHTVASFSAAPILSILAVVTAVTVMAGVLGCWGIFRRPALETLRAES
ncbi:MAG TPA: FtsX-like permease family protein [Candidatus Acidoferrales bacterium]|nr:FtsX-like permease family protein [Candidatus Acidoferrales bacterium]